MSRIPHLKNVLLTLRNGIALTQFNRPKTGNSLSPELFHDMHAALKWATTEPSVRVIIHTGMGKFYCTGMELSPKAQQPQQPGSSSSSSSTSTGTDDVDDGPLASTMIDLLHSYHEMLITTSKITIAAVNGPAVGWGVSSLGLHDLVYSVDEAYFFTPFVKWGMCAEACSSFTFASIIGYQKAAAMVFANERVSARELEGMGMVTKVLPKEGFLESVWGFAEGVVKMPPESLRVNKDLLRGPWKERLLEANERECEELRRRVRGEESREAIKGFEEEQRRKRERSKI